MTNRLSVPRASSTVDFIPQQSGSQVESATYSSVRTGAEQPVAVFAPVHYEPNYAYPLIVWLHGPGDDESQLKRIMPHISLRNYVGTSVRGTTPYTASSGKPGFAWAQSQPHVALAEQRVFDAVSMAEAKLNVSRRRIFLAGFDCGGTMALRVALAHPRQFAGAISLGGEFPVGGAPLAGLAEARQVPVFVACGRESQRYPSSVVCENLKLLHSAGMNLTLRQYPGGHDISPDMLADMDRWIIDLITGGSAGSSSGSLGAG